MNKKANEGQESTATKYRSLATRVRELTISMEDKENENQDLKDSNIALQAELDSSRSDCEGMLKVFNTMGKKIAEFESREESVNSVRI